MEPVLDLLAYACAATVLVATFAAPVVAGKGKSSSSLAWIAGLIVAGFFLAQLQYDGRGTFLMYIAMGILVLLVSAVSLLAATIGRSGRKRASQQDR